MTLDWLVVLVALTAVPAGVIAPSRWQAQADDLQEALKLAGISPEKAAEWMELDASQLRRQLAGDEHLSYARLMLLPLVFRQWLWLLGAERDGLPRVVRRAVWLRLALRGRRKPMAAVIPDEPIAERRKA